MIVTIGQATWKPYGTGKNRISKKAWRKFVRETKQILRRIK